MPSLYYGNLLISSGTVEHETLKISIAKVSDFPSTLTLPENTVELGNNCFKGCSTLTDVALPDSLVTIGNNCFDGCSSLSSITIPDTVTAIGSSCFNNCISLDSVSFKGDPPTLGSNVFSGLTFTAYYDYNNTNWTASVKSENYGGATAVTWLSIQPGLLLNIDVLSSNSSTNGIKDISGNANHGSLSGSVSIDKGNTYFDFDGANNSKIEVNNSSFIDELNGKTALTLSITAKCTDINYPRFGGLQQSSGGYFFGFLYFSSATTVCFGDRMSSSSEAIKSLTATTTPLNWHNYTVTVDYLSGVAILYIDGVEKARSTEWFQGTKANVDILRLGQSSSSGNSYKFKGHIRNVLVYNKVLTAEEVMDRYNSILIPEVDSSTDYIAYKLHQINESNKRYPIEYVDNLSNCIPIKYYDGVTNMGSWESWINSHFTPVMLKSNGTVDYELNRNNLNYKADGTTASDISNTSYDGNAMLKIKKFYISCGSETVGSGSDAYIVHTVKICDSKLDNTYTCWGFVNDSGVEKPFAYYALFNCYKDSNGKLRSLAGITLNNSMPGNQLLEYGDMITAATANGTGWNISNLALENAIGLVLMMIYKCVNPMFVNQDSTNYYRLSSADNNKITGSRAADGGFPYVSVSQQQKALWLENYWRYHDSIGQSYNWVNGLGSLKTGSGINDITPYYRTHGPYNDFTTLSNWTPISGSIAHTYSSDNVSHELHTVSFHENIMFPADNGVTRQGAVSSTSINRYFGGGWIDGNGPSNHYTDKLMPCRTGGPDATDQYFSPPHFVGIAMPGTGVNNYQKYGAGRLTYLPQS